MVSTLAHYPSKQATHTIYASTQPRLARHTRHPRKQVTYIAYASTPHPRKHATHTTHASTYSTPFLKFLTSD